MKVQKFDDVIQDKLDEWIYFLKNGEVKEEFTAKGLNEAKERLDEMKLSEKERIAYQKYLDRLREIASENHTKGADAQKLIEQGEQRQIIKTVLNLDKLGLSHDKIAIAVEISITEVKRILKEHK